MAAGVHHAEMPGLNRAGDGDSFADGLIYGLTHYESKQQARSGARRFLLLLQNGGAAQQLLEGIDAQSGIDIPVMKAQRGFFHAHKFGDFPDVFPSG